MSNEVLGIVVNLSGNREAVSGFDQMTGSTDKLVVSTNKVTTASEGATEAQQSLAQQMAAGNYIMNAMREQSGGLAQQMATLNLSVDRMTEATTKHATGWRATTSAISAFVGGIKNGLDIFEKFGGVAPLWTKEFGAFKDKAVEVGGAVKAYTANLLASGSAAKEAAAANTVLQVETQATTGAMRGAAIAAGGMVAALAPLLIMAALVAAAVAVFKMATEGMGDVLSGTIPGFTGLTGVIKPYADALKTASDSAEQFGDKFGYTVAQSRVFIESGKALGVSSDGAAKAMQSLSDAVVDNASAFEKFDIDIKGADGSMLSMSQVAANVKLELDQYATEADRAGVMLDLLSGNTKKAQIATSDLDAAIAVDADYKKRMALLSQYNLLIGQDAVDASDKYTAALDEFNAQSQLTWRSFTATIGAAVMPMLTDLFELFTGGWPRVAQAFRDGVVWMVEQAYSLRAAILGVVDDIGAGWDKLKLRIAAAGDIFNAGKTGDMSAVKAAYEKLQADLGGIDKTALDKRLAREAEYADRVAKLRTMGRAGGVADALGTQRYRAPEAEATLAAAQQKVDNLQRAIDELNLTQIRIGATIETSRLDYAIDAINKLRAANGDSEAQISRVLELEQQKYKVIGDAINAERDLLVAAVDRTVQAFKAASKADERVKVHEQYLAALQRLAPLEEREVKNNIQIQQSVDAATASYQKLGVEYKKLADAFESGTQAILDGGKAEIDQLNFEIGLIGKEGLVREQAIANRKIELEQIKLTTLAWRDYYAALNAAGTDKDLAMAAGAALNRRLDAIKETTTAQAELTVKVLETGDAYKSMSTFVDGFINAAMSGFSSLKNFLKNQLFDWLKQSLLKPFIMQIAASVTGGGGVAGAAASALGGGGESSIIGSIGSSVLGSGSFLGSILGTGSIGTAVGVYSSVLAGTGSVTAGLTAGAAALVEGGGILGAAAGVLAAIPVWGWAVLAAAALYAAFGGSRDPGFKIDNNLSNVGNPASHFTANAISAYDVSGKGTDAPAIQAALKPVTTAVNTIDELLANKLLGADVLAKIRGNMSLVNNASSWEHLDKEGIEKGTKSFLMQRYGTIFDEVDAKIAASVRGFSGTSEELLRFIGGVVAVMTTLKDNAAYFKAVIGESVSVGQISALQKEGETLDQTLTRVVNVFTATNGVAALMGKDVATAFGAVGLASLEARQNLIDLAGGIQSLDSMSKLFYDKFYTEQERGQRELASANATVAATFTELNIAVPQSRAAFRALVEAQDLTTEAGRRTWVALMRVAGAFDTATSAAGGTSEVITVRNRGDRSMGPGAASTGAAAATQDYLDKFFTETERRAMKLAESARSVDNAFLQLGITTPKTRAEFRAIVDGIDQSTERGRWMYGMLMSVAGAFADVTDTLDGVRAAAVRLSDVRDGITTMLEQMFANIDSTQESMMVKLQRKLAAATQVAAYFDPASSDPAIRAQRDEALRQQALISGDLALLVGLQAQYGNLAEQMFGLEKWRREAIAAAAGNALQMAVIEQAYADRRNAILVGGLATGLSTLRDTLNAWLKGLLLNSQLSTLTPMQRLEEARRQYETALTSGNASQITGTADAYLREARDYFASGPGYSAIFNIVRAQVAALVGGATPAPTPSPGPRPAGSIGGGSTAAMAASDTANAAATTAVAAANATVDAVNDAKAVLAELMANVKYAIDNEGQTTRDADAANTTRIVGAIAPVGGLRVAV